MTPPARRDGTPDRPRRGTSSRRSSGSDQRRHSPSGHSVGQNRGQERGRNGGQGSGQTQGSGHGRARGDRGRNPYDPKHPGNTPAARRKREDQLPATSSAKPARHQVVSRETTPDPSLDGPVRLQKVLAQAGVASRRVAEEMILDGRVEVDGEIVTTLGTKVDPATAIVRVDGTRVVIDESRVTLALNKPRGWLSTMKDEFGRPCVGDILSERVTAGQRLFHVGRLDADTEGLLLVTNDGELAHRLMHPSHAVPKTYLATVNGVVGREVARALTAGVELEDGVATADKVVIVDSLDGKSLCRIIVHEGRKHIVRRMFDHVGHPVIDLVRTHVGEVALGEQRPGTLRKLNSVEMASLCQAVGL